MKFFIPTAKDDTKGEELYEAITKFAQETTGWKISNRRIFSIDYFHEHKEYHVEVGKPDPMIGEVVMAILESKAFLVCTPNRGVVRGMPILVGINEATDIIDFAE
jgi:hypothetical protein